MAKKVMSSRDARRSKKSGYVQKTLQRAKEATYHELERLTDEQIRRVMRTLEIQARDVQYQLEKKGISIPIKLPTAPDAKTLRNRSQLIQIIGVHRAYIEAGRTALEKIDIFIPPRATPEIIQQAIEALYEAYEGYIEWFYIAGAVHKVVEDGAFNFDDIVKKASNIIEERHPEFAGWALSKIKWRELL